MTIVFDDRRIAAITHDIAEAIEEAGAGNLSWTVAAELLTDAFPGGFSVILNSDFVHGSLNFTEWAKIDPQKILEYTEHYYSINPWADGWLRTPSGSVFVAEEHMPASSFAHTEFYNDWLKPQGDVGSGVGLKVDAGPADIVCFPVHYPARFAKIYDRPATEVSRRLIGPIKRAIRSAREMQSGIEIAAAGAAVAARSWPALVVDSAMTLCNANTEGQDLLSIGSTVRCKGGKVSFVRQLLNQQITTAVAGLAASSTSSASACAVNDRRAPMVVTLTRLPKVHHLVKPLISGRRQILLIIKQLTNVMSHPDLVAFGELFRLTPSELRLCVSLVAGRNLQEAAIELGVTYETIRHRTKTVFQKTGIRSQTDLVAMLNRYMR